MAPHFVVLLKDADPVPVEPALAFFAQPAPIVWLGSKLYVPVLSDPGEVAVAKLDTVPPVSNPITNSPTKALA